MQLFDNFENQSPTYIPNNMFPMPIVSQLSINNETVSPRYRGCRLVGYEWNWGDKVSIEIKNQIEFNLPEYGIYTYEDVDPTDSTEGTFVGQKYYNLYKLTSFTLTAILDTLTENKIYIWTKDEHFTYPSIGVETIKVPIALKEGEQIVVQLFNFRKEIVKDWIYYDSSFTWELTPEESLKLVPGIYFLNIHTETREDDIATDLRLTNEYEIFVKGF